MKHFLKHSICLFVALSFLQCRGQQNQFALYGTIQNDPAWQSVVYLVQPTSFGDIATSFTGTLVDSSVIQPDGKFHISGKNLTEQPTLYFLCQQRVGGRFFNKLEFDEPSAANFMPIVLQKGQTVEFNTLAGAFFNKCQIPNASPNNTLLMQLRDIRLRVEAQIKALPPIDHSDESAILQEEARTRQSQTPFMNFADTTTLLLPALVAVRWTSLTGDYERLPEFIAQQCAKWRNKYPNEALVAQLCRSAQSEKLPVMVGDTLPNFPLPLANGDTITLHQLLGSQCTILDLWASWCAPCRKENRTILAPLNAEYHDKGLQIIGYSIDNNAKAWKGAIEKDGAQWVHASHLSGDETPFFEALRLSTIPANFVVDAHGKILAKNLHGEEMLRFIESYFKK